MEYLTIGKVSKLKNVSIKSLRYYDKIGVFKPAYINTTTNYRYYTQKQLYLLDAIHLCLELGIPLKDLHKYVQNEILQIQPLLHDSKMIADTKIKEINLCMEQLEATLSSLQCTFSTPSNHKNQWLTTTLLLLPIPLDCGISSYGSYILQLFVTAQKNKLQANYPSGILYERKNNIVSKYIFLEISSHIPVPENNSDIIAGYYLRTFQEKICANQLKSERCSLDNNIINAFSILEEEDFIILEIDILDTDLKEKGYHYQLVHYL